MNDTEREVSGPMKNTNFEEILQTIRDVYNEYGKISTKLYNEHGKYTDNYIRRNYGKAFSEAVELAGLPTNRNGGKGYTKQEVIDDVLRVYNQLGVISRDKYIEYGKFSRKPILRYFGSWNNLLTELDIDLNQKFGDNGYSYTEDELLADLVRLNKEHGNCNSRLVKEEGMASIETYQRRFGSFNEALEKAGLNTRNAGESIIEKQVISRISMILDENPELQKKFDWLRNDKTNRPLPADAYFPKANLIIEYNGEQHYNVTSFIKNDNEEALAIRQYRDEIKHKLIKEHDIKLLVIKYDEPISNIHLIKRLASVL